MKQATNIRFTPPAIFRAACAGLLALVLGLCPLPASAQTIGAACAVPPNSSVFEYTPNSLVCDGGVWKLGFASIIATNNILIGTITNALPTGLRNIALGYQALYTTTTGSDNVAIGYGALFSGTAGTNNTAIGSSALNNNSSATNNTAVGYAALATTTGSNNTAVGVSAGQVGVPNTTGTNNTLIGYFAQVNANNLTNATAIGNGAIVTASNMVRIGDASVTVIQGKVAWTFPSDRRLKKDIQDSDLGLDFIEKLRPVSYRLKEGNDRLDYGFIAQELEKALDGRITNMVTQENDKMKTYRMRGNDLIAPLVKAVQEQQQIIEKQQKQIDALEKTIRHLAP